MRSQRWFVGERQRIRATFSPGALSGPPTQPITVDILGPYGSKVVDSSTASPEDGSDTQFYFDFTPSNSGVHKVKFTSFDEAAEVREFLVYADEFE